MLHIDSNSGARLLAVVLVRVPTAVGTKAKIQRRLNIPLESEGAVPSRPPQSIFLGIGVL
jgi:hypothetical protein